MRQLTIKRTKSSVACLSKIKLYIEDATANDLVINGVACRKLGEIKNGEEATFEIGEEAAKVFAIAGKASKSYCNEYYPLPAGQEDLYLTGKNRYNPASGNAFRFDNNDTPEVLTNRKKSTRKGILVLCLSLVVGFAFGYFLSSALLSGPAVEPQVFSDNGMSVTLTNEFQPVQAEGHTHCYESPRVAVFALKEEFTLMEGFETYTLEQYRDLVITNNGISATLKDEDGLKGFAYDYTNPATLDSYHYVSFVYKTQDAFWLVQFVTMEEDADDYKADIATWAKSVFFEHTA